ncbi:uncharacterized protein LOC112090248 [Eutrema salsugineum]|uniref:uncharacterized protein LOC112090248 n=1 Tax=Eutrema salsugineum TaxID=72664 RepID=UPI000CED7D3F|nr:uncharacterized protein LOC112090248 [Eutrema salsugineum]
MGGLGFRDLKDFNLALLAKQLWRLIQYPSSLLARVLRGRYYRQSDPLEDRKIYSPSYGWRSMMAAKPYLQMGIRKTIGSGLNTRAWSEPWIPDERARPPRAAPQIGFQEPGMHMGSDKQCPRCGNPEESINHLLFLCPPGLQVWALSDFPSLPGLFPSTSIYQNMSFLFWNTKELCMIDPQKDFYPWILWYIWKARNDKIFDGKETSPVDTLIHAKIEAESWKTANEPKDVEEAALSPSPSPSLRTSPLDDQRFPTCQVDASWIGNSLVSGLGWSLKEEESGEVFGLQGCRRSLSALHAELESLLWAMSCLIDRGVLYVHFQSDCLDLISMTESPSDWPSFLSELEVFQNLRGNFGIFTLSHIPRILNTRADTLAKGARAKGIIFFQIIHNEPMTGSFSNQPLNWPIVM